MAVLKLGTINLDHRAGIAHQTLRDRFHGARFAGTGRSQKKEVSDGASGRRHSRDESLVYIDDLPNGGILADDLLTQLLLERLSIRPQLCGIQHHLQGGHFVSLLHCLGRLQS